MINKIVDSYRQFGLLGFCVRGLRKIFSIIGLKYEDYYLLTLDLNTYQGHPNYDIDGVSIKQLAISDFEESFEKENLLSYPERKQILVKERIEKKYESYGAYYDNKLVYASWISYSIAELPGFHRSEILPNDTALLLDDFCAPHMRHRGIHGRVNLERLNRTKELNIRYVIVTVMCMNKPAVKSHLKNGFKVFSKYYTLSVFGKEYTNLDKVINKYESNR